MIHVVLKCRHCGTNLMDTAVRIDDHPGLRVTIEHEGTRGDLHLSSRYGSYTSHSDLRVGEGEVVRFLCPHCAEDLGSSRRCYQCGAPMVTFESELGGYLRICSRKGCTKHVMEFERLETELRAFYTKYSTFFAGEMENDE